MNEVFLLFHYLLITLKVFGTDERIIEVTYRIISSIIIFHIFSLYVLIFYENIWKSIWRALSMRLNWQHSPIIISYKFRSTEFFFVFFCNLNQISLNFSAYENLRYDANIFTQHYLIFQRINSQKIFFTWYHIKAFPTVVVPPSIAWNCVSLVIAYKFITTNYQPIIIIVTYALIPLSAMHFS